MVENCKTFLGQHKIFAAIYGKYTPILLTIFPKVLYYTHRMCSNAITTYSKYLEWRFKKPMKKKLLRLIFTGFKGIDGYGGAMTFKLATSKENGELVFEDIGRLS